MSFDKSKKNDLDEKRVFATESVNKGNTADLRVEEESISKVNKDECGLETKHASREASFTRRAVIKAGWIVPVILAVGLPPGDVFAQSSPQGSGTTSYEPPPQSSPPPKPSGTVVGRGYWLSR